MACVPCRIGTRVAGAHEWMAHENYVVYFAEDESTCTITVLAAVHVARHFP
jgi:toxin ParE1/3/4